MIKSNKTNVIIPWKTILSRSSWHTSYIDYIGDTTEIKRYIFIPYEDNNLGISMCITNAYNLALTLYKTENWKGFEVKLRIGNSIGQEIDCLYIEILPIKNNTQIELNNV
jgi:hypothetical protein